MAFTFSGCKEEAKDKAPPAAAEAQRYYKIHKDVPDLIFSKNNSGKDFKELAITNSETKKVINTINLLDYTLFGDPPASGDTLDIEFIDVNFDGYKDIRIFWPSPTVIGMYT